MQAVCDTYGGVIDISICFPAASSNFVAFHSSRLRNKLETVGLLAPG
jgi:hypothetical protein